MYVKLTGQLANFSYDVSTRDLANWSISNREQVADFLNSSEFNVGFVAIR